MVPMHAINCILTSFICNGQTTALLLSGIAVCSTQGQNKAVRRLKMKQYERVEGIHPHIFNILLLFFSAKQIYFSSTFKRVKNNVRY